MPKMISPELNLDQKGYESDPDEDSISEASSLLQPSSTPIQIVSQSSQPRSSGSNLLRPPMVKQYSSSPHSSNSKKPKESPKTRKISANNLQKLSAFRAQSRTSPYSQKKTIRWIGNSEEGGALAGTPGNGATSSEPHNCQGPVKMPHIVVSPESDVENLDLYDEDYDESLNQEEQADPESESKQQNQKPSQNNEYKSNSQKTGEKQASKVTENGEEVINIDDDKDTEVIGPLAEPEEFIDGSDVDNNEEKPNGEVTQQNGQEKPYFTLYPAKDDCKVEPALDEQTPGSFSFKANGVNNRSINDSLILCISALYAKILVVMGMAFPIAEIISHNVPLIFYNSFYLYLYFGSIFFLVYAYLFLLRAKSLGSKSINQKMMHLRSKLPSGSNSMPSVSRFLDKFRKTESKNEFQLRPTKGKGDDVSVATATYKYPKYTISESTNHGSMYLKMGAIIFGIGSMIYSGLEFGQYFELSPEPECSNLLMAISPVARMIFTFLQMYFIFLNSRVVISKHTIVAQFGMMHMIATNLCIWLNVLVQETKHEIAHLTQNEEDDNHTTTEHTNAHIKEHANMGGNHHMERRAVESDDHYGCRQLNLMGHVVNSSSPFLFPCTIEYSLLCAGVLYVMWKNISNRRAEQYRNEGDSDISTFIARKVRHHYSVDCARASRGLFMGIFVLVLTIISLILFYVLISNENFKKFAILEANIIEVSIYSLSIVSVVVGMKQMRELEFILEGDIELDNILLIIAQAGVYIYSSFTIIGGYFSQETEIDALALTTAMMTLIQTTLQTLFILDGSRRCCYTADQLDRKPGREMVTFLLVCNLAMWAISTFETSRAEVHPTQLQFYGIWAWTIISHVSMPLAIFYRFHVTVCLGEIWKRAYKLKTDII